MRDGVPSGERSRKTQIFSYGKATLQLSYVQIGTGPVHDPAIFFTLGDNHLALPQISKTRGLGLEIAQEKDAEDSSYVPGYNIIRYREKELASRFGAVAFMEEYQHSQTLSEVNEQLRHISRRRLFHKLPRIFEEIPGIPKQRILDQKEVLQTLAGNLETGRFTFFNIAKAQEDTLLTYLHEVITKKRTVNELLIWSNGDLSSIIGQPAKRLSPEELERNFFEWYYLTLLAKANSFEDLLLFSSSMPLPVGLGNNIEDFKRKLEERSEYLETGINKPGSEETEKSWIAEDYRKTALYQYWFKG